VLAGVISVLLAGCTTSDVEDKLRFGWPTGVTKQAHRMRELWTWSSVAALIVGVVVWGLIFWCCGRYYKRDSEELPRQTKYNLPLEIGYTIVPFLIIAGLFYFTVRTEDYVNKTADPDVQVQVNAFKWNWQFEYLNYRDPQTHQVVTTKYPGSAGNVQTVGTSSEIPVLVIPSGVRVLIHEHALDVIHSFWVPEFLFKRDVIPYGGDTSRDNKFEITATSEGAYVGRCAELCGTYHSQMNFQVTVVSMQKFQAYVQKLASIGPDNPARQSIALQSIGQPPCATTTYPFNTDRRARAASEQTGVCG
jgi:cytochrome c oxidase subunit 2